MNRYNISPGMLLTRAAARPIKVGLAAVAALLASFIFLSGFFTTAHVSSSTPVALQKTTLNSEDISRLCTDNGYEQWSPPADTPAGPRRVYDMFLINSELDWLEIRLHNMASQVDYFVVVESGTTFTGLPKPTYLQDAYSNFSTFHDKMIHRVVTDPGPSIGLRSWDHEDFLRNALVDEVFPSLAGTAQAPREGDVLIVSDVDEIPKPETLLTLRHCNFPVRLTLRSQFYYYSFQWRHRGRQWQHPQATTYQGASTISPQDLRSGRGGGWWPWAIWRRWRESGDLWNAAWHCSSCFATLAEMQGKMAAFSHTKWNTAANREAKTIIERVRHGLDLFGRRGENYDRVDANPDVPRYILQQKERFGYMLDRDGENAGFWDTKKRR